MRLSSSVLVLAVACLTLCALAAGAQTPQGTAFTYQGELRQNTIPVNATTDMVFRLYDASVLGNQIGPTLNFTAGTANAVPVVNGIFTVALDFGAPAFISLISDERYLEIAIDGNVLTPRTKIENAPFALQSQTAELAYAVSNTSVGAAQIVPTQVQKRVTGTCPTGSSIQSIAQDGSVTCQTAGGNGTVTSISAGSGLSGGTITSSGTLAVDTTVIQQRVAGACAAGQYLQQINADGSVQCGVDTVGSGTGTVTSVGAGLGLTGGPITTSGTLAVDPTLIQQRVTGTCPVGSYMRGINVDGSVQCTAFSQRTVFVTQVGTPQENGAALLAAVASIAASASDPWLVKVDVGVYDLDTSALTLTFVSLEGSGEALTTITSAGGFTVKAVSSVGIRELTIANSSASGAAIFARSLNLTSAQILVTRTSVTATHIAIEAQGDSQGVYTTAVLLRELTISAGDIGILDGDISSGAAGANQLTATSIDVTTPASTGRGLWVRLTATSKPRVFLTHSFVRGSYWRYGDSETPDQFQAYFTDAFGSSNGFPALCGAMAFGSTLAANGSCP